MDEQVKIVEKILAKTNYAYYCKLSQGSYGDVYQILDRSTGRHWALKVIDLSQINKLNKMHEVMAETNVLKRLRHPGIVKLRQMVRWQGLMGLVLELGCYGDLFKLIKLINHGSEFQARKHKIMKYYLAQILQILDYLDQQGIVHRDIKPENFVIAHDLRLRLVDFGTALITTKATAFSPEQIAQLLVATQAEVQNSRGSMLVGSVNYLSPQALKIQYSSKSDVWAFGVLTYKFVYDILPFDGDSNFQIFQKIAQSEIVMPKANPSVVQFLSLCLKKNPEDRATPKMLKLCSLVKDISFKDIFELEPPLYREQINQLSTKQPEFLLELVVDKKMFFGNFKPRLLTIEARGATLVMAYRYLANKETKKQFALHFNDYALASKNEEFQFVAGKEKYIFRVLKGQSAHEVSELINSIIRKNFNLL